MKPVYEDNGDCVLLYACGWQEYASLPSNSHIKHNLGGGDAAGCCSGTDLAGCGGCGGQYYFLSYFSCDIYFSFDMFRLWRMRRLWWVWRLWRWMRRVWRVRWLEGGDIKVP